jgi:endonuclease/exonuclease/phosphatase family metal-dependent hydrolase
VWISPAKFWVVAFFGLGYPYFLLANLVFLVFWLIKRKWEFILSLTMIALGWQFITRYIPFRWPRSGGEEVLVHHERAISFMSYNVRLFDLFDWSNDVRTREDLLAYIREQSPDILCVQEFYASDKPGYQLNQLKKDLGEYPFFHIYFAHSYKRKGQYGIATFSRYPIVRKETIRFDNTTNISIFTDIVVHDDTMRVFNNHLQSIRLMQRNYDFLDSLSLRYSEEQVNEIKDISLRLREAFVKRSEQVDQIASRMDESPFPIVVCGDFNDTPVSYAYHRLSRNLEDAFAISGSGRGITYLGRFPSYRIDFILHSPTIESRNYVTHRVPYSDHYPITCRLVVR